MPTHYELARPTDDPELRRLLRENPFPGSISLSFDREPDYFQAAALEGEFSQTLLVRDTPTGRILGIGDRSVRRLYVNEGVRPVGYFSGLRVAANFQYGMTIARLLNKGFEGQREMHKDGRASFYLMSIISDNQPALRLLNAKLPNFPQLHPFTRMLTFAIHPTSARNKPSVAIERGTPERISAILGCLARHGMRTQFAPYWTAETLFSAQTPGLAVTDFFLALDGERVAGCLALWDQQSVKQSVIRGYSGSVARFRWAINLLSRLGGWAWLPEPGTRLNHCFACFAAVDGDDVAVFKTLLSALIHEAARRSYDFVMLGLPEGHPFVPVARAYHPITYQSNIYLAAWEDGLQDVAAVDNRPPGLEIALL